MLIYRTDWARIRYNTLITLFVVIFDSLGRVHPASVKQKRQIFREQVLPHTGGKIPESAFHIDRLALNRLNKEGISVPDGVLFEHRRHQVHPQHADHPCDVIKVFLTPDGRYVPREGRHYPDAIDTTYIIRQPLRAKQWSFRKKNIYKPIYSPLQIPNPAIFGAKGALPFNGHIHSDVIIGIELPELHASTYFLQNLQDAWQHYVDLNPLTSEAFADYGGFTQDGWHRNKRNAQNKVQNHIRK